MIEPVAPGVHAWETKVFKQFRAFAVADGGEVVLIDPVAPDADEARAIIAAYRRHLAHPVERLLVSHGRHILAGARAHMLARLEQGA